MLRPADQAQRPAPAAGAAGVGWANMGVTVEAVIVITADRRGGAALSGVRGSAGSGDRPGAATGLDANALRVQSPWTA